jgi:hypothetical protein
MPSHSSPPAAFDPSILEQLACPVCQRDLQLEDKQIACAGCGRVYLVLDGIPVLIPERAADRAASR